jgi:hypothetical protein
VKLTSIALFGAGYVLGTRAGRERYAQIVAAAEKASERFGSYDLNGSKPSERLAEYINAAASRSGRR